MRRHPGPRGPSAPLRPSLAPHTGIKRACSYCSFNSGDTSSTRARGARQARRHRVSSVLEGSSCSMILVRVSRATSRGAGRVEKFRGRERDLERARGVPTLQLELQQCRHFDVEDTGSIMRVTKMDVEICSLRFPGARQPLMRGIFVVLFLLSLRYFVRGKNVVGGRSRLPRPLYTAHSSSRVTLRVWPIFIMCSRVKRVLK